METKEIKINVPEGYEIDEENSTFECIKFKKKILKSPRWRDKIDATTESYHLTADGVKKYSGIVYPNAANGSGKRFFATEKIAKSALAMAQISQIMENDERFGGAITNDEWDDMTIAKWCIIRCGILLATITTVKSYHFLAFHTENQLKLFFKENEDLIKDYLMIE